MKHKYLGMLSVLLLVGPTTGEAALISSNTLNNVLVGSTTYDVVFWQDANFATNAAQVATLPITFNDVPSATAAFTALQAALNASPGFDFTPANSSPFFYVVYSTSTLFYSLVGGALTGDPVQVVNGLLEPAHLRRSHWLGRPCRSRARSYCSVSASPVSD